MHYKLRYPLKKPGISEPVGKKTILGRKKDFRVHTFQANDEIDAKNRAIQHLRSAENDNILAKGKITLQEGISAHPTHFQVTKNILFKFQRKPGK
jgi:hypothetical protein